MKRDIFGGPRPLGEDEITEALDEKLMDPTDCSVVVDLESTDDGFGATGFVADVTDDSEPDRRFSTRAYQSLTDLESDLDSCDLTNVDWDNIEG